ncbi:MAG: DUF5320 domain-containing protein [Anaerolineales bacterium]|nr:DUF5320 domain-containing protein [Anaerolineales bacterium]
MPGGDRTGPAGAGPRTGRGMGYCSGYNQPGFANQALAFRGGFGYGRGGGGRGWRNRFYATGIPGWAAPTSEQEAANLKAQADLLQSQLDAIQKRIEELKS